MVATAGLFGYDAWFNARAAAPSIPDLDRISQDTRGQPEDLPVDLAQKNLDGLEATDATRGAQATLHGAERLGQGGLTDELIALTKSGQVFRQADNATVYIKETSPGRFNFIIESERGVVTAHRNWPLKEIQGIAERYGWEYEDHLRSRR